jgi:hypothetical protein
VFFVSLCANRLIVRFSSNDWLARSEQRETCFAASVTCQRTWHMTRDV